MHACTVQSIVNAADEPERHRLTAKEQQIMSIRMKGVATGLAAAALAVGLAAGTAAATQNTSGQPRSRGAGMGPGGMGPGAGALGMLGPIRRLDLTDAQKDQVRNIVQSHAEEFKTLADRSRDARRALQAAINADPIDDAAIRQKSAEVAAVQADMAVAGAHVRAEVLQVLTPAQRERLKTLTAERQTATGRGRRGRG
ncbi:MAG: Spy/CpxP family protein refolding chaperone [Acidobacteria bacterium]|nr:Spy/CpxP family protein refolding chaperone [Acidobacteriota bacterium]